jgi:hypothetical protein
LIQESQNPQAKFSSDGKSLLNWTEDVVSVWEAGSWVELARLDHGGTVLSASFVPGGRLVATVSEDLIARQWILAQTELIERAGLTLTRNLTLPEWRRNFGREPYAKTCSNIGTPNNATTAKPSQ